MKTVEIDLKPIPEPNYPPPRIPDDIDLSICPYAEIICDPLDYFRDLESNELLTEEELFILRLKHKTCFRNSLTGHTYCYYIQIPITHSCYKQAIDDRTDFIRESFYYSDVTPDYRNSVIRCIKKEGGMLKYGVRVFWYHSPAPDGVDWGSNNWTNEQGMRDKENREKFYLTSEQGMRDNRELGKLS